MYRASAAGLPAGKPPNPRIDRNMDTGTVRAVETVGGFGLAAIPPDHPARVAARLMAEVADRLAERVDSDVRWTVRQGWGDVAPRRDGGAEALLDDLARRRTDDGWGVAICLTDLPLHSDRLPLVAQTSARRRVAMVPRISACGVTEANTRAAGRRRCTCCRPHRSIARSRTRRRRASEESWVRSRRCRHRRGAGLGRGVGIGLRIGPACVDWRRGVGVVRHRCPFPDVCG